MLNEPIIANLATLLVARLFYMKRLTTRLLQILDCLPGKHDPVGTEEFHLQVVERLGRQRSLRTTQRDLNSLRDAKVAGFVKRGNANGWFKKGMIEEVYLKANQAMDMVLVLEHGARFGMSLQVEGLSEIKDYAERVLREASPKKNWSSKRLTSATRFITLSPAPIGQHLLENIQDALLRGYAIKVWYRIPERDNLVVCYLLHPQGLSFQDSNIYLSCYVQQEWWQDGRAPAPGQPRYKYESAGPKTMSVLQLHRVTRVEEGVAGHVELPADYDINSIAVMKDLVSLYTLEPIELELRLKFNLQKRLTENPLAADQVISPDGADRYLLKCRIHDGQGLRLWLLSNADEVEVVAPADLRQYMRATLSEALSVYAADPA